PRGWSPLSPLGDPPLAHGGGGGHEFQLRVRHHERAPPPPGRALVRPSARPPTCRSVSVLSFASDSEQEPIVGLPGSNLWSERWLPVQRTRRSWAWTTSPWTSPYRGRAVESWPRSWTTWWWESSPSCGAPSASPAPSWAEPPHYGCLPCSSSGCSS